MLLSSASSLNSGDDTGTGTGEKKTDTEVHEFGCTHIVNINSHSFHHRVCKKCGLSQEYGRLYGSNKYPGYKTVDPKCPGKRE